MGKGPLEVRHAGRRNALVPCVTGAVACVCLQIFKFSVYVTIPVLLTVAFAASPQNLQAIITNVRAYTLCCASAQARALPVLLTRHPARPHSASVRRLPHRGAAPAER